MRTTRLQRKLVSWVALVALLMASVAPAISHAMRSNSPGWIEICTAWGSTWVRADGPAWVQSDGSAWTQVEGQDWIPTKASQTHTFSHCPYCALHAMGFAPAPTAVAVALLPLRFEAPRLFFAAPRTLHAWLAAQPRGPPFLA